MVGSSCGDITSAIEREAGRAERNPASNGAVEVKMRTAEQLPLLLIFEGKAEKDLPVPLLSWQIQPIL
jgi:hypothetical protein